MTAKGIAEHLAVPWAFSEAPAPGEGVPNEPTPQGRELGRQLARLVQIQLAKPDAAPGLPMCNDCAFREGTLPNGCAEPLMDAIKCAVEAAPFFCHKGVPEGGAPKRLCSGFAALMDSGYIRDFYLQRRRTKNRAKAERRRRRAG